jgi:hypothetical protein
MDLRTKAATRPIHDRLRELSAETGETVLDLALAEILRYQQALVETRASLAELVGR